MGTGDELRRRRQRLADWHQIVVLGGHPLSTEGEWGSVRQLHRMARNLLALTRDIADQARVVICAVALVLLGRDDRRPPYAVTCEGDRVDATRPRLAQVLTITAPAHGPTPRLPAGAAS